MASTSTYEVSLLLSARDDTRAPTAIFLRTLDDIRSKTDAVSAVMRGEAQTMATLETAYGTATAAALEYAAAQDLLKEAVLSGSAADISAASSIMVEATAAKVAQVENLTTATRDAAAAQAGFGGILGSLAGTAAVAAAAIGIVSVKAVEASNAYQQVFLRNQALTTQTLGNMKQLEAANMRIAEQYGIDPTASANSLLKIQSSGFQSATGDTSNATQILSAVDAAVALSRSKGQEIDPAVYAEALTKAMVAYNLPSKQAQATMDMIIKAESLGNVKPSDIAANMGRFSAQAASLGIPLSQVLAEFADLSHVMTRPRLIAGDISSQLQTLITNPTAKQYGAAEAAGLQIGPKGIQNGDLFAYLERIDKAVTDPTTGKVDLGLLHDIAGQASTTRLLTILFQEMKNPNINPGEFNTLLGKAGGTTQAGLNIAASGQSYQWAQLTSKFSGDVIQFGDLLSHTVVPGFLNAAKTMENAADNLRGPLSSFGGFLQKFTDHLPSGTNLLTGLTVPEINLVKGLWGDIFGGGSSANPGTKPTIAQTEAEAKLLNSQGLFGPKFTEAMQAWVKAFGETTGAGSNAPAALTSEGRDAAARRRAADEGAAAENKYRVAQDAAQDALTKWGVAANREASAAQIRADRAQQNVVPANLLGARGMESAADAALAQHAFLTAYDNKLTLAGNAKGWSNRLSSDITSGASDATLKRDLNNVIIDLKATAVYGVSTATIQKEVAADTKAVQTVIQQRALTTAQVNADSAKTMFDSATLHKQSGEQLAAAFNKYIAAENVLASHETGTAKQKTLDQIYSDTANYHSGTAQAGLSNLVDKYNLASAQGNAVATAAAGIAIVAYERSHAVDLGKTSTQIAIDAITYAKTSGVMDAAIAAVGPQLITQSQQRPGGISTTYGSTDVEFGSARAAARSDTNKMVAYLEQQLALYRTLYTNAEQQLTAQQNIATYTNRTAQSLQSLVAGAGVVAHQPPPSWRGVHKTTG